MSTPTKKLDDYGISHATAAKRHAAAIKDGVARVLITDKPIPLLVAGAEAQRAGVQLAAAPSGDGERIWYATREKATADRLGEPPPTGGFRRVLVAFSRGPYDGQIFETELGELDDDGLLAQPK